MSIVVHNSGTHACHLFHISNKHKRLPPIYPPTHSLICSLFNNYALAYTANTGIFSSAFSEFSGRELVKIPFIFTTTPSHYTITIPHVTIHSNDMRGEIKSPWYINTLTLNYCLVILDKFQ